MCSLGGSKLKAQVSKGGYSQNTPPVKIFLEIPPPLSGEAKNTKNIKIIGIDFEDCVLRCLRQQMVASHLQLIIGALGLTCSAISYSLQQATGSTPGMAIGGKGSAKTPLTSKAGPPPLSDAANFKGFLGISRGFSALIMDLKTG